MLLIRIFSIFLFSFFHKQNAWNFIRIRQMSSASSRNVQHNNFQKSALSPHQPCLECQQPLHNFRGSFRMSSSVLDPKVVPSKQLSCHPGLVEGRLDNGFSYVILPNAVPPGRFEAHLEVLSGSAHELEDQQGMAHLLEHVAYMGSPKRQLISGTGSRTNAYTDFHHTVFYAACPAQTPDQFWKKPMLPMALDALLDVMTTRVDDDRLEKERAAVLSEASMVNKMEYRVECQVLSALHSENRISQRFPIGKEPLIRTWSKEAVQRYHHMHYRPDNVILFVIGDVDVATAQEVIKQKFGPLQPKLDTSRLLAESGEYPPVSMQRVSRHFPPVVHRWSCAQEEAARLIPPPLISPALPPQSAYTFPVTQAVPANPIDASVTATGLPAKLASLPTPRIFKHELLQGFSFHLFAKRPIEPITTLAALRRELMRRMALSALQIRFNVQQRQDPLFTFIDFNQMNWPREGCAVCSLDLTTETTHWREAVRRAVVEIRRLGHYGLSETELGRYKQAVLAEATQNAAERHQASSEEVLTQLMEAHANGHTYLDPVQYLEYAEEALADVTVDDMKDATRQLCEHLSHMDPSAGVLPAAIVACAPLVDRAGSPFAITEGEVVEVIRSALEAPLEALIDTQVPDTLITPDQLEQKRSNHPPAWATLDSKVAGTQTLLSVTSPLGSVQRKLSNGIRVNMISLPSEPQRVAVRLFVPGGRMRESRSRPGEVLVGTRTIQEGGAFADTTREEVEMFCIDQQVMVDIVAKDDALILDFSSVTTPGAGGRVTGLEAVMQVVHVILSDFKWEQDAFERAKQGVHEQYDATVKSLEQACQERLVQSLTQGDGRLTHPTHADIDALDLDAVQSAVTALLAPTLVEITIAGDASIDTLETLVLDYLGTVPKRTNAQLFVDQQEQSPIDPFPVYTMGRAKQLGVYLPDSDERAMGYLAGMSPNKWGVFGNGSTVAELLKARAAGGKQEPHRAHPLFGHVVLKVLQEVANRRLFSTVREERRLTYDASFQFEESDLQPGGWFLVSVTSSPPQVQAAIAACKEALASLKGPFGVMGDSVQSAKRTLRSRFRAEISSNKFWVESLCGTQLSEMPLKSTLCISEYEKILAAVTVTDVAQLIDVLALDDDNAMTTCVGIAAPIPPPEMRAAQQAQAAQPPLADELFL